MKIKKKSLKLMYYYLDINLMTLYNYYNMVLLNIWIVKG